MPCALGAPLCVGSDLSNAAFFPAQFSTILDSYKQHSKGWSSTFNKYAEGEGGFLEQTVLYACLSSWAALSGLHRCLPVSLAVLGCLLPTCAAEMWQPVRGSAQLFLPWNQARWCTCLQ